MRTRRVHTVRVCLQRFRGFAPKNPTTFEKVDETFVLPNFTYSL